MVTIYYRLCFLLVTLVGVRDVDEVMEGVFRGTAAYAGIVVVAGEVIRGRAQCQYSSVEVSTVVLTSHTGRCKGR